MSDVVLILVWVSICGYWVYLHIRFYLELKNKEPSVYKANSAWSPLKYTTGFACFDFALSGEHKNSSYESVVVAGNRLVKAYEVKFKVLGIGFFLSCLWFALSLLLWGVR